jgi:hypothetical protein
MQVSGAVTAAGGLLKNKYAFAHYLSAEKECLIKILLDCPQNGGSKLLRNTRKYI